MGKWKDTEFIPDGQEKAAEMLRPAFSAVKW
jgi:hypothetical protein